MKAVIFDFDGTLTYKSRNVWKAIWQDLGYDISKESYFAQIYMAFMRKEISHQKWCDLTCDKFKEKNMNRTDLLKVAREMKLVENFGDTIKTLHEDGYSIHIVSGCISEVIRFVIKDSAGYINSINGNNMEFNEDGSLEKIVGTKYDFEGKADFINDFKEKTGCRAEDIIFIGNSSNDEWACKSGCKTICINPEDTCVDNKSVWHKVVPELKDLKKIVPLLLNTDNGSEKE